MTFVVGSYQAVEHPGAGHRAAKAGLWRGEDLRTLNEVAMTVLPAECAEDARREVESVAAIRHPHLLPVIDVVVDDDRVAVVCPWPAGGRLAELVVRRGVLSVGETLTVLIPLMSTVAAAHGAGLRHGGLSPESIWFDTHGRPLVGSLAVGRLVADLNDGMPIGSRDVAPEVVRGERLRDGPVTTAADVFSVGSIALFCLTGRSAWPADEPADVLIQSAAGLWPDPPDDAGPPGLLAVVRGMLRAEAGRRPGAQDVLDRLVALGEPAPIAFTSGPAPVPAAAGRWRGWAAGAVRDTRSSGEAEQDAPDTLASGGPATTATADGDRPAGRGESARRRADLRQRLLHGGADRPHEPAAPGGVTPLARAGIALLVGLLITMVAVQVGAWWVGWDQPGESVTAGPDWVQVVTDLDAARGRALAAADPALLSTVYLEPASAAGATDLNTINKLADNGWRVVDGVHEIVSVTEAEPLDPGPTTHDEDVDGDDVRLVVVDTLPSRVIVDADGAQVGRTPARDEERRVLVIRPTGDGYRIAAVESG